MKLSVLLPIKLQRLEARPWGSWEELWQWPHKRSRNILSGWGEDWQRSEQNGEPYQRFEHMANSNSWNSSQNSSSKNNNSSSWDDWDDQGKKGEPAKPHQSSDSWAGWDDGKDDGFDSPGYNNHNSSNKGSNHNGTSGGSFWREGGFSWNRSLLHRVILSELLHWQVTRVQWLVLSGILKPSGERGCVLYHICYYIYRDIFLWSMPIQKCPNWLGNVELKL